MKEITRFPFRLLLVLLILSGLSSCALSELNLELSLYKDDLQYSDVLTKNSLKTVDAYLSDARENVDSVADIRIGLAEKLYASLRNSAKAQFTAWKKNRTPAQIESEVDEYLKYTREFKDNYIEQLHSMVSESKKLIALAQSSSDSLKQIVPENAGNIDFSQPISLASKAQQRAMRQELKLELTDVSRIVDNLITLNQTPFQKSLEDRWPAIVKWLSGQQAKNLLQKEYSKQVDKAKSIADYIKSSQNNLISLRQTMADKLAIAQKNGNLNQLTSELLKPPFKPSDKLVSKREKAFNSLNSTLEQMQDPGSPIWRIVTDPSNQKKWNKQFNKTLFDAAGNSDVVVVRDSPMDYRIQEGSNNPEALVQAQLGVSRAIADAAIQMAGAATGSPLVSAKFGQGDKVDKNENPDFQSESEALTSKKAALEREAQLRRLAVQAMTMTLRTKLEQLHANHPSVLTIRDDIIQSLKARKSYFENKQGEKK